MKLGKYIENLQKIIQDNPEFSELQVITSIDDEGNGYNNIHYRPSVRIYEDDEFTETSDNPTVICVN